MSSTASYLSSGVKIDYVATEIIEIGKNPKPINIIASLS